MTSPVRVSGPTWDLDTEYAGVTAPELAADLATLTELMQDAVALHDDMSGVADAPGSHELEPDRVLAAQQLAKIKQRTDVLLGNISTYANCLLSVDSQHQGAQQLNGQLQNYRKRSALAFEPLNQFLNQASNDDVDAYLADEQIAASAFEVHHQRLRRHEQLPLVQENLVSELSQNGIGAWGALYSQLSGTLSCEMLLGNEVQQVGLAEAAGSLSSVDDHQRKQAWQAINTAWQGHAESCAAALNAQIGWRLDMNHARSASREVHYLDDPIHQNKISRATLNTLMEVARETRPLAQRAAKLQARAYGKNGFGPWDSRAPAPALTGEQAEPIAFENAVQIIADAYATVHPDMGEFVHMMVENRWVEGSAGPSKRPGAYCTRFAKSRTPRVYMTYSGGQSDVITLAHELGHAFHSWVMRDLPDSQKRYGMSLAETASTFGEALVRDALLANAATPQQQLKILWEEISAFTTFLLNIPTRFEFERNLYEARQERPLTALELNQLMSSAWQAWYGDALAEPDPLFWASKLHFYMSGLSFYNFPYLFGYLFSLGIYTRREDMGDDFYQRYKDLLSDTGRMTAEQVAHQHLHAELDQPDYWRQTIARIAPRVDLFESLLDEVLPGEAS